MTGKEAWVNFAMLYPEGSEGRGSYMALAELVDEMCKNDDGEEAK